MKSAEWITDRFPENTDSEDPRPSISAVRRTIVSKGPSERLEHET